PEGPAGPAATPACWSAPAGSEVPADSASLRVGLGRPAATPACCSAPAALAGPAAPAEPTSAALAGPAARPG
ncbi:hypothetical protein Mtub8_01775, partial [Mycobacterium tuberculosis]